MFFDWTIQLCTFNGKIIYVQNTCFIKKVGYMRTLKNRRLKGKYNSRQVLSFFWDYGQLTFIQLKRYTTLIFWVSHRISNYSSRNIYNLMKIYFLCNELFLSISNYVIHLISGFILKRWIWLNEHHGKSTINQKLSSMHYSGIIYTYKPWRGENTRV